MLLDPTGREARDRIVRLAVVALRAPCALLGVPEFGRLQLASGLGIPEPWRLYAVV